MSIRFHVAFPLTVAIVGFAVMSGCSQSNQEQPLTEGDTPAADVGHDDYNPHDVPLTEEQKEELRQQTAQFPDAVEKIQELRSEIEAETKDGIPESPYKAHQALDRADLLLQWFPEIARDSGVPKEHWETITPAANELRELFDKVHQNIDNKKDPDFASVEQQMDARIGELQAIAQ
ncbi:MAG: hypothetical protein ACYTG0_40175 [Planctomycetota bacterium]|jgi:hypothetical protein